MKTIELLKQTITHMERMESNKTHFYAMRAACRPELLDKMEKHLQHAIVGAKQDAARISELAVELQKELT